VNWPRGSGGGGEAEKMAPREDSIIAGLEAGGNILVSRLKYLGDVILTLPLVAALRERFPTASIDYLCKRDAAAILEGDDAFGRVFALDDGPGGTVSLVRRLRRRRYLLAVDLLANPRSALLTFLSGARMRIGGARRVRKRLYTHAVSVPASIRSAVDFHLYHLRPLGIDAPARRPELGITANETADARRNLEAIGVVPDVDRVVAVHPGGKWEVKRWPLESFAALAAGIVRRLGARILVVHGPGEKELGAELVRMLGGGATLLPLTPLRRLAAILKEMSCVVVGDGGIMHVSVAVGTPTVGIFGSSEPDIWFPYGQYGPFVPVFHPIECRPCHLHECDHLSCLRGLEPEKVLEKVIEVFANGPRTRTAESGTRETE